MAKAPTTPRVRHRGGEASVSPNAVHGGSPQAFILPMYIGVRYIVANSVEDATERWAREVRKGTSRLVVLSSLAEGEAYGYQLLQRLRSARPVPQGASEATLYPLLHELEAAGFLSSRWAQGATGVPARKYYRLNKAGVQLLSHMRIAWKQVRKEIDMVVNHD